MKKENKTKRILELYRKLMTGQSIRKRTEADYYGVDERTIQRDIAEIRTFIENDRSEKSNGDFLAYDYREHRYHLEEGTSTRFKDGEILAVCKILLDSRAFPKKNMEEIIDKLLRNCVHPGNSKMIAELIDNEKFHYIEPQHKKDFLEMMWEIGSAIRRNLVIEVNYRRAKDDKVVQRRLQPVAILFSEFYFYLTAFIDGIDKKTFQKCRRSLSYDLSNRPDREYQDTTGAFSNSVQGSFPRRRVSKKSSVYVWR